jgi:hypothetical protein
MLKNKAFILHLFIIITAFGCKSTSTAPENNPPQSVGQQDFGFSFDGTLFERKNYPSSNVFSKAQLLRSPSSSKTLLIIMEVKDTARSIDKYVQVSFTMMGKLPDTVGVGVALAISDSTVYLCKGKGSAILTVFDTVNNVISGTFNFEGVNIIGTGADAIEITSGRFINIPISIGRYDQGMITASIDGASFSSTNSLQIANIDAYTSFGNPQINIQSQQAQGVDSFQITNLNFTILNPKVQEYDLSASSNVKAYFLRQIASTNGQIKANSGKFTITQVDSLNHIFSATFDFFVLDPASGKSIHVANGLINNVRWLAE